MAGCLQVRRRHFELSHMLLRIMRHIDALEGRFAASQNHWDAQSQEAVAQLAQALQSLEAAIAPTAAGDCVCFLAGCWWQLQCLIGKLE